MKIIVDSACDMSRDILSRSGVDIETVPLALQLSDMLFDGSELDNVDKVLTEIESRDAAPQYVAPSPSLFTHRFNEEDDSVFVVTLSSGLSDVNNSAQFAKNLFMEEIAKNAQTFGQKFIHVFDSLSASVGETLVALKISEFYKNKLSNLEIVENVNSFIQSLKTYTLFDKFDNAVKAGWLSPYVEKITQMFNIKPICGSVDGKLALLKKAHGYHKAVDKLIDMIKSDKTDFEQRTLGISHVKCAEKAIALRDAICAKIPFRDSIVLDTSGLVAACANRGGLIVAY